MVTLSLPTYSQTYRIRLSPNAPTTIGTTVTFFSFHNVPIYSLSWRNCYFPILSSSFSFTSASPGMPVSMILVSFACLSTKMMSGLLAGFNHTITLFMEIPYNFKTYYHYYYYYCLFDINLSCEL